RFISSTFFRSRGATNGPFLSERDIVSFSLSYYLPPRRRTINWLEDLLRRVFLPRAGLPQGVLGPGIPMGERPSPPPCGCDAGSMAIPRTEVRLPSQRRRPALPITM